MAREANAPPPRAYAQLTLAEQMLAWISHRQHLSTSQIGRRIGRTDRQVRAVLFGGEV